MDYKDYEIYKNCPLARLEKSFDDSSSPCWVIEDAPFIGYAVGSTMVILLFIFGAIILYA